MPRGWGALRGVGFLCRQPGEGLSYEGEASRPKPSGGRRQAKLEPHRAFLLEKVAEKADITMPELAAELAAATCQKADPASLSRWLIRIGYRFKRA